MQKLNETINKIEKIDYALAAKTQKRLDNLTKPQGSLGRLEEIAKQVVEITKKDTPSFLNKVIFTMAGDHGVVEEGVSAFPQAVTPEMVYNFINGGAGINVLAGHVGARVIVVDMGVAGKIRNVIPAKAGIQSATMDSRWSLPWAKPKGGNDREAGIQNFKDRKINFGTKNMAKGPAMTRDEAIKSIEAGIEVFENELPNGIDIVGTGDMGIGNTTPSSAITSIITGMPVKDVTGRGTGINDEAFINKIKVIQKAIEVNKPDSGNGIDVLSKVGGFEIGGLAGIMLAAASRRVPAIVDGFISGAAALIAYKIEPKVKDYMIAAHCSVESGHKIILNYLGLKPILDLNLRLGEGTGAALAMNIIEASLKILTEMATFESAQVSEKIEKQEIEK